MAWYDGTYSCGHEGTVSITGPSKDRQRKADYRFSGLCPECYKKQLEKEKEEKNVEAARKSEEMDLPELSGTEKQVAWANTLRVKQLEKLNERFEKIEAVLKEKGIDVVPGENIKMGEVAEALEYFIHSHTDAKYWIESRDRSITLRNVMDEFKKHMEEEVHMDAMEETAKEEESLTCCPETEDKKPGIAKILLKENVLSAHYIKDDDFRGIVKGLGYRWDGTAWVKQINEFTGSADERAAELGNKLLLHGFSVQFPSLVSKDAAVPGTFSRENDRWVKYDVKAERFAIVWKTRSDTLYNAAKKLPGARWKDGSMRVGAEFYSEVEDFAETMGFSISALAREKMDEYKKKAESFEPVFAKAVQAESINDSERIRKTLETSGAIIEDLKDE